MKKNTHTILTMEMKKRGMARNSIRTLGNTKAREIILMPALISLSITAK
jgi:hypothetical protein